MRKLLVIYFGRQPIYAMVEESNVDGVRFTVRSENLKGKGIDEIKNIISSKYDVVFPEVEVQLL